MVIGFGLTIRGNPSDWQIIRLVLMMLPVGVAPALKMSEKKDNVFSSILELRTRRTHPLVRFGTPESLLYGMNPPSVASIPTFTCRLVCRERS